MANEKIEDAFKNLLVTIAERLKQHGFSKRGNAFRRVAAGNAAIIEVQRSQSSSYESIRFTLNVGIVSGRLLDECAPDVSKAKIIDAHLRVRIGAFLSEPTDKWWRLDAATSVENLSAELSPLISRAAQFLIDHSEDAQLVKLWESGRSPGLTEIQRQRNLRELKAA